MSLTGLASRGVVLGYTENQKRTLKTELFAGEVRDKLEHFEPYGFTSAPKKDGEAECLAIFFNGDRSHGVVACVTDRRYRPKTLKEGEVCIFDDLGRYVYLSRDGIRIEGKASPITVTAEGDISITSSQKVLVTAAQAEITAKLTKINGDCEILGQLTAGNGACKMSSAGMESTGDIKAQNISLLSHKHSGVEAGGGTTGGPTP